MNLEGPGEMRASIERGLDQLASGQTAELSTDLDEVTVTLPQNVWQAVEDLLGSHLEDSDEIGRAFRALRDEDETPN
jgi:hypothetical protein